jgi:hypothetical protein
MLHQIRIAKAKTHRMVLNSPKVSVLYCGTACVLITQGLISTSVDMALYRKYKKASCCGGCELTLSGSVILTGDRDKLLKFSYDHRLLPKSRKVQWLREFYDFRLRKWCISVQ